MTEQTSEAVRALREVLDGIGRSLVGFDLDGLLAAGPALDATLSDLQRLVSSGSNASVRAALHQNGITEQDITAAREALRRCEQLGASLDDLTRISVSARNALLGLGYDRTGRERGPSAMAPSMEATA
jgi:hypothetical protein